jgi:hypothetical protein
MFPWKAVPDTSKKKIDKLDDENAMNSLADVGSFMG